MFKPINKFTQAYLDRLKDKRDFLKVELNDPSYLRVRRDSPGYELSQDQPVSRGSSLESLPLVFIRSFQISYPPSLEKDYLVVGRKLSDIENEDSSTSDILVPFSVIKGLELII